MWSTGGPFTPSTGCWLTASVFSYFGDQQWKGIETDILRIQAKQCGGDGEVGGCTTSHPPSRAEPSSACLASHSACITQLYAICTSYSNLQSLITVLTRKKLNHASHVAGLEYALWPPHPISRTIILSLVPKKHHLWLPKQTCSQTSCKTHTDPSSQLRLHTIGVASTRLIEHGWGLGHSKGQPLHPRKLVYRLFWPFPSSQLRWWPLYTHCISVTFAHQEFEYSEMVTWFLFSVMAPFRELPPHLPLCIMASQPASQSTYHSASLFCISIHCLACPDLYRFIVDSVLPYLAWKLTRVPHISIMIDLTPLARLGSWNQKNLLLLMQIIGLLEQPGILHST